MTKICAELPHTKSGKIKIEQFMKLPILSEEAFKAIDKNRFDCSSNHNYGLLTYTYTSYQRWFHHQRGAKAGQQEELDERDQPG